MGMILVQGHYQFKHPLEKGISFIPRINDWQTAPDWIKESQMFVLLYNAGKLKWIDKDTDIETFAQASKDHGFETAKIAKHPEQFTDLNDQLKSYSPPTPGYQNVIVTQHLETPDSLPIVNGGAKKPRAKKTTKKATE